MRKTKLLYILIVPILVLSLSMCLLTICDANINRPVNASFVDASEVQSKLKEYGYYDGELNGVFDDKTVVAIKNFQSNNGLEVTGAVNGATASALGIYMSEQDNYNLYLLKVGKYQLLGSMSLKLEKCYF